jgi:hypothetical protein
MATAVGGSIQEISIDGRTFPVAADADASRKLGGYENENQPNGDGTMRKIMKRVGWVVSGLTIQISDIRDDQAFLQSVANKLDYVPITITYPSGITYQARGTVAGELAGSSETTTAEIELSGPGELTQQ